MYVRVRGIYATAITKILIDKGINITHSSKKIRERFNIKDQRVAPEVTIKDVNGKYGVVVVGEYNPGKHVFDIVKNELKDVYSWTSKLPLHAIIKGKVKEVRGGKAIIDLNSLTGVANIKAEIGQELLFDVMRPVMPNDDLVRLSTNYTIYGKYVALIHGLKGKVIISEHITRPDLKRSLKSLSSLVKIEGNWGIKWRSSATLASINDLMIDLQETQEKANKILQVQNEDVNLGEIVYSGHFFGILGFNKYTKECLDKLRSGVITTIDGHHMYKSLNNELTQIVDYTEYLVKEKLISKELGEYSIIKYICDNLASGKLVEIEHISILTNKVINLTPGVVTSINIRKSGEVVCRIKRIFKGKGVLDGLNVSKEPGDYDLMEISSNKPIILHKYFSRYHTFKGLYVNINSIPEFSHNKIRYFDLEIDVIMTPDNRVEIIDLEKLDKANKLNIVSDEQYNNYTSLAEKVKKKLQALSKSKNIRDISIDDVVL